MPEEFVKEVEKASGDQIKEVGIEWCIHQSKELKAAGVPCLHYYTMGDSDTIAEIASSVS